MTYNTSVLSNTDFEIEINLDICSFFKVFQISQVTVFYTNPSQSSGHDLFETSSIVPFFDYSPGSMSRGINVLSHFNPISLLKCSSEYLHHFMYFCCSTTFFWCKDLNGNSKRWTQMWWGNYWVLIFHRMAIAY